MFKKISIVLALVIGAVAIGASGAYLWYQNQLGALSQSPSSQRIVIKKGATVSQIAQQLEDEGIIKSALAFRFYTQLHDVSDKIFAGEFELSPSLSVADIVKKLQAGPREVWVTIPEGMRREEMSQKIAESLGREGAALENFQTEFLRLTTQDEGYLFPDTYLLPKEATPSQVVKKLKDTFNTKVDANLRQQISQSNRNVGEVVILASILERETRKTAEEGPMVAGILLKRIEAGWPIQADATVQYALTTARCGGKISCPNWWPQITRDDYQFNSPFNTYKIQGLPPTPIASPGLAAIKAAANPQESPYWYYIHDSTGTIRYAETLQQHNQNIDSYLR